MIEQFHFKPRRPEGFLAGGQTINLGTVTAEIISTPGHTAGHMAFFFKEPRVLFIGDYDLSDFGPWYGDVESSIEETIASVERLRHIPARVWMAGHEIGLFEEEPGERWDQYLGVIQRREEKLLDLLKEPRTLEDIVNAHIFYGKAREPKEFFDVGENGNMKKHLERLVKQGSIKKQGRYYCRCR